MGAQRIEEGLPYADVNFLEGNLRCKGCEAAHVHISAFLLPVAEMSLIFIVTKQNKMYGAGTKCMLDAITMAYFLRYV